MPAAISAYSIAVVPDSSVRNAKNGSIICCSRDARRDGLIVRLRRLERGLTCTGQSVPWLN
jgi:hypothetical protein